VVSSPPNARSGTARRSRQELDARRAELEIRENLLKSAEKRLDGRRRDQGHGVAAGRRAQQKKQADAARLKGLVTMYENMRAKDAAKIFDRLEMRVLIDVVSLINPRRMSDIMAQSAPKWPNASPSSSPTAPAHRVGAAASNCRRSRAAK